MTRHIVRVSYHSAIIRLVQITFPVQILNGAREGGWVLRNLEMAAPGPLSAAPTLGFLATLRLNLSLSEVHLVYLRSLSILCFSPFGYSLLHPTFLADKLPGGGHRRIGTG